MSTATTLLDELGVKCVVRDFIHVASMSLQDRDETKEWWRQSSPAVCRLNVFELDLRSGWYSVYLSVYIPACSLLVHLEVDWTEPFLIYFRQSSIILALVCHLRVHRIRTGVFELSIRDEERLQLEHDLIVLNMQCEDLGPLSAANRKQLDMDIQWETTLDRRRIEADLTSQYRVQLGPMRSRQLNMEILLSPDGRRVVGYKWSGVQPRRPFDEHVRALENRPPRRDGRPRTWIHCCPECEYSTLECTCNDETVVRMVVPDVVWELGAGGEFKEVPNGTDLNAFVGRQCGMAMTFDPFEAFGRLVPQTRQLVLLPSHPPSAFSGATQPPPPPMRVLEDMTDDEEKAGNESEMTD